MKLLISHPDFQKDIAEARHEFGIPKNGFPNEESTPAGSHKKKNSYGIWADELNKTSGKILDSKDYTQKLKQLHADLLARKIESLRAYKNACREVELTVPLHRFHHVPKFLAEKYRLPDNFVEAVRLYFTHGLITAPPVNFSFGPYEGARPFKEYGFIPVKIYARLTQKELAELGKEIELMGEHMPRYQPLKDIDRKLKLEDSYLKRADDFDHATGQSFKTTAADIAQVELGSKTKRNQVYEAQRELKNMRKKLFGKS